MAEKDYFRPPLLLSPATVRTFLSKCRAGQKKTDTVLRLAKSFFPSSLILGRSPDNIYQALCRFLDEN